jgi:hypothetical protein
MQSAALCGRQSCLQAAFQAAVQQTTHAVRTYSSGFVFAGIPQRSLRNSSRIEKAAFQAANEPFAPDV